ncbi:MAG: ABC transporter permease [Candidatus Margulisbacteria bacterium]|nr:ABC transporter permease [Candidatus Margulisiibacteriota bacterium]MBU1729632.1 ABC transporter permease [Candidatus Margulisiibacteriota bacterium]MBU1954952.1 ABC transporter permease [Candidatus Margulisiibacteriota bacterium]
MNYIGQSVTKAFELILGFDPDIYFIVWTSVRIAATSAFLATLAGVPLGLLLALKKFKGKRVVSAILNTLMAVPTVVIGILVYSFLTHQAPLGSMGLLFTPTAIVIGQFFLAFPIVAAMVFSVAQGKDKKILKTAYGLGATPFGAIKSFIWEIKIPLLAAIMAGFGRVIGEVGVAMMLGGNIYRYTRTMTTAIALETSKGEFALGLALGFILLIVALGVNSTVSYINYRSEKA